MPLVCIDCRYVGKRPSGIAEAVVALVEHAPRISSELDYLLLCQKGSVLLSIDAPNVTSRVVSAPANGPGTMWFLPDIADLGGVDLFHATFNILPARLKMKTVTTVHDIMWLDQPQLCTRRAKGFIDRHFYGHGIKRALAESDRIATVSTATREAIIARSPDSTDRIRLTRSGVGERFAPRAESRSQLAQLGIEEKREFILTVGQYAPYKNHEGVLKAFARAFGDKQTIDLVLVQRRSANRRSLGRLAARLGIVDRVHFLDEISEDELIGLYSSALALLHPSFCEGFGNPLAEAMACGCPVITSNCSAMPEVTAGAARLVDPHDEESMAAALRAVAGDDTQRMVMRKSGLRRAAELRWEDFAQANVEIYRELLG